MNNKISIILPARKKDGFLDRAIESVMVQTYSNWELVIVANGNLVNEKNYLCKLGNMPKTKIVYSDENVGAARNKGIEAAAGNYITFIDSDDYLEEDSLYKLMLPISDMDSCDGVIVTGGYTLHHFRGKRKVACGICEMDKYQLHSFLLQNPAFGFTWGKLYSLDIFEGIKYPENCIFEDIALLPYIVDNSIKSFIISDIVYNYDLKSDSLTYNISEKGIIQGIDARINNYNYYFKNYNTLSSLAAGQIIVQTAYGLSKFPKGLPRSLRGYIATTIKKYYRIAGMYYAYFFMIFPSFSGKLLWIYTLIKNGNPKCKGK